MNKRKVILWGATGQSKVINECLSYDNLNEIIAIFDNKDNIESSLMGVPIFYKKSGFEKYISEMHERELYFCVAIGGDKGYDRVALSQYLQEFKLKPLTIIHPKSNVAKNVIIGEGSQILINATLSSDVKVGKQAIINTSANIDHDCIIGDGVHVCPGAHLAGEIQVGDYATIGTGAIILPRIKIGKKAVIGAGAVVTKDVDDYAVVVGNPARVIKFNKTKDQ